MAITTRVSTPGVSNAGTQTPTVAVPSDAANGDILYAWLTYGATDTIATQPAGWTVVATGTLASSGQFALVKRTMATGVTQAQWTITTNVTSYGKSTAVMVAVRDSGTETVGTVVNRATTITTTDLPGVTVPTSGILLAFAGDRVSSQTSVTAPTGMTELVKSFQAGLGGGTSALIASSSPAAGASGTKTVTYGVASINGAGLLLALAPAVTAGVVPAVSIDTPTVTIATGTPRALTATVTGETSVQWSQQSGPPVTPPTISNSTSKSTATVTPTVPGIYVFRLTATNATGPSFGDMTVRATGTTVVPVSGIDNSGGFVAVGADSVETALGDGLDTTYAEAPALTGDSLTELLAPLASGATYTYRLRARSTTAPAHTVTVAWLQGSTVIATRNQVLTASFATYVFTLTSAEAAAVTNRIDIRMRVTAA